MTDDELKKLVAEACERFNKLPLEDQLKLRQAQMRSYVLGEIEFGSDEDENAYTRAIMTKNRGEIQRLEREGKERRARAVHILSEMNL